MYITIICTCLYIQADVLLSLYRATEGSNKWQSSQGWKELLKNKHFSTHHSTAHMLPAAGASTSSSLQLPQQQQQQQLLLAQLQGIQCDLNTGEVLRIQLSNNNLHGQLPGNLGLLTTIRQLVLSNNHIGGKNLGFIQLLLLIIWVLFIFHIIFQERSQRVWGSWSIWRTCTWTTTASRARSPRR